MRTSIRFAPCVALLLVLTSRALGQEHVHEDAAAMAEPPSLSPDTMSAMLAADPGEKWLTMVHGFAF
jgi:hypothetical protein